MSVSIQLPPLSADEATTLVFGLLELQRALALSTVAGEEVALSRNKTATDLLTKLRKATDAAFTSPETVRDGAQRLADLFTKTTREARTICEETGACPACAFTVAARTFATIGLVTPHKYLGGSLESEHKAGNA